MYSQCPTTNVIVAGLPEPTALTELLEELFGGCSAVFVAQSGVFSTEISGMLPSREVVKLTVTHGVNPLSNTYRSNVKRDVEGVYTATEHTNRPQLANYLSQLGCNEKLPRLQKMTAEIDASVEEDEDGDDVKVTKSTKVTRSTWKWVGESVNGVQNSVDVRAVDNGVSFTFTVDTRQARAKLLSEVRAWAQAHQKGCHLGAVARS